MGSELMKIAEGFSIVAEGLRGLAKVWGVGVKTGAFFRSISWPVERGGV